MKKLYPRFSLDEFFRNCSSDEKMFAFHDYSIMSNLFALSQLMQSIRDYCKSPVLITSGYRDSEHNKRVYGVTNSQHLYGSACDFMVVGITDYKKLGKSLSNVVEFDQLIIYPTFIHISYHSDYNRNQIIVK